MLCPKTGRRQPISRPGTLPPPKSRSMSHRVSRVRSSASSLADGVGDGEESPGLRGYRAGPQRPVATRRLVTARMGRSRTTSTDVELPPRRRRRRRRCSGTRGSRRVRRHGPADRPPRGRRGGAGAPLQRGTSGSGRRPSLVPVPRRPGPTPWPAAASPPRPERLGRGRGVSPGSAPRRPEPGRGTDAPGRRRSPPRQRVPGGRPRAQPRRRRGSPGSSSMVDAPERDERLGPTVGAFELDDEAPTGALEVRPGTRRGRSP